MENLLNIVEVEKLLQVKKSTLRSWVFSKRIPFIKVGRLVRFKQSDIEAWLQKQTGGGNNGKNTH